MKKNRIICVFIFFCIALGLNVSASESITEKTLIDFLPKEMTSFLAEYGFEKFNAEELINISITDIFNYLVNVIKAEIKSPLVIIYIVIIVVIVSSVAMGIGNNFLSGAIEKSFSIVSILTICTTVSIPIITIISRAQEFINNTSSFIKAFVPALSAVMMAGGKTLKGAGYQVVLIAAAETVSVLLSSFLIPVIILFLCFSIVSRLSHELKLSGFLNGIKNIILWSLTLLTTLFVSFITIKGAISAGADSLALRTGKFFLGNFIPAIGGSLSEAAASIVSSINLIENTVGIFGIIAITVYFIPILIQILIYKFVCDISYGAADCLGAGEVALLMKDISSILGIINAIILNYAAIFILSTAITLSFGGKI